MLFGLDVLDLGCGVGVDCFILSKLVGAGGHVIGVDLTQEQVKETVMLSSITSLPLYENNPYVPTTRWQYIRSKTLICEELRSVHLEQD